MGGLRRQLFAVSLLTLALPWAGWRYVTEMESALRRGLEQSLLASAITIARALDQRDAPFAASDDVNGTVETTVYAHAMRSAPLLDGFVNDWNLDDRFARTLAPGQRYWAGIRDRYAYLFLDIADDQLVYQTAAPVPTSAGQYESDARINGDRVVLGMGREGRDWLLLQTAAPGNVRAQHTAPSQFVPSGEYEDRVHGVWMETLRGYTLEIRIPVELIEGKLGIGVIDVDGPLSEPRVVLSGTWQKGAIMPGPFQHQAAQVQAVASQFEQRGRRLRIVDGNGWVLYDAGAVADIEARETERTTTLSERLLRWILRRDDPLYRELERPPGFLEDRELRAALKGETVARWYQRGAEANAIVAAAVPIPDEGRARAAVVLEQSSDAILTLTNSALVRLMTLTLLATVVAAVGLLGYATLLSFRVRRLARAAETALSPQGEIMAALPGQRARDELGDLSRSFADLLSRLREYTNYLRTLKGKLAHELRTPLAVVSTSLDNIDREHEGADLAPYLRRIREGSNRLTGIIDAMSEATAIEQAVADFSPEPFQLASVAEGCVGAYRDVYPDRAFQLTSRAAESTVVGSPDLLAQMLDKLIDNAVSFSERGSTIDVVIEARQDEITLSVSNPGPLLPSTMRSQLFDSLVSIRKSGGERRHLGLGLYVAALIARAHRGQIDADNLEDGSGVVFRVSLPLAKRG